jgi:hypothetical protein
MLKREKSTSITAYCAVAFPHALTPRPGYSINLNLGSTSQIMWMISGKYSNIVHIKKNYDFSPQANYTDRATIACQRSLLPTFADSVCRGQRNESPQPLISVF